MARINHDTNGDTAMKIEGNFDIYYPKNDDDWLQHRGIGGSTAGAILGANPWMSKLDLYASWKSRFTATEKTKTDATERGHRVEPIIRADFANRHPEYKVIDPPKNNWVFINRTRPYMTVSLDGVLWNKEEGFGVWEGKSHEIRNREDANEWASGKIPQTYYVQVLHEMNVPEWHYVWLTAYLIHNRYDDEGNKHFDHIEIRDYLITDRDEGVAKDKAIELRKVQRFYEEYLVENSMMIPEAEISI